MSALDDYVATHEHTVLAYGDTSVIYRIGLAPHYGAVKYLRLEVSDILYSVGGVKRTERFCEAIVIGGQGEVCRCQFTTLLERSNAFREATVRALAHLYRLRHADLDAKQA